MSSGTLIVLLALSGGVANAQTITVTSPMDESDVPSSATLADLPGPDGVVSFREALLVSDNVAGNQTIGFEIPQADWYLPDIYPGLVLIQASLSFSCSEPVTIDGTTQTAFTGDTNPAGNEVVLGLQTYLDGDGTVVTGLHASRVELDGSSSLVHGNTGSMDIRLYFGTGSLIRDNEADTISLHWSSDNVIVSNTTRRIRMSAGGTLGVTDGNRVGGPDPADSNFITGWGNYGEHGFPAGDTIQLYSTSNTLIENNYIGTTPDGMAIGNQASTAGIAVMTQNDNLTIKNNLIAIHATHASGGGYYGAAIYISHFEGESGVHIIGNTIGLNALGERLLGALHGIWIDRDAYAAAHNIRIGGSAPGEGNIIAGHASTGIMLEGSPGIVPRTASGSRATRSTATARSASI